jgi:predicted 3-demethylubiquinone-9 3-methyltransferase (glyoxalase superfamily)
VQIMSQQIRPFLWFDNQAEEAANFYVSLFDNSRVVTVQRNGEAGPGEPGSALVVEFELNGQTFLGLNGGPQFSFTEAISFMIDCADQAEVDRYWDALTADGGEPSACGWLKDKYGLSWQVTPRRLMELLGDADPGRAGRAMQAMMQMQKIDVAALERAADAA